MSRSKWHLTRTRNRGYAYFWLMFMPRPVQVGYLDRSAALKRPMETENPRAGWRS
jgi:hypothetical protein